MAGKRKVLNNVTANITLHPQNVRANLSSSSENLADQMGKIQKWFSSLTSYAVCNTNSDVAQKEVSVDGFVMDVGSMIVVKFANTNSASISQISLKVNDNPAAYIRYRNGTIQWESRFAANCVYQFIYDGTYWQVIDGFDANYAADRTSIQGRIYAGEKGCFQYSICGLDNLGKVQSMTTTGGTGTSKTFNSSQKFMYPPVIFYNAASSNYAKDAIITNNVLYDSFYCIDMRYSCNITTTVGFTKYIPIYIECTFDSNGYWSPTGITQSFTAGKYYILLGLTYSNSIYQMALISEHPVFYCKTSGSLELLQIYTKAEKDKLAGIEDNANNYSPTLTKETIGSASVGTSIGINDITGWTTNTPSTSTIANGILTMTSGTAASLSYTERSIPNINITQKDVVTNVT